MTNHDDQYGLEDSPEKTTETSEKINDETVIESIDQKMSEEREGLKTSRKEIFKSWWQASRPPFYIATLVPLILGFVATVKYGYGYHYGLFALILFGSFVVHLATNLANDVFDHEQGVDAGLNIGGSRVIQEKKISPGAIKKALLLLYSLGFLSALAIILISGQHVLWLLIIFSAASSFFYVAPPVKYGHRAMGELFVFINMGLIMPAGTFLALASAWDTRILTLALPVAFMVAGILYYQSLPEIETDLAVGKHTLANVLGKEKAAFVFMLWWPLVWLLMISLWLSNLLAWPAVLCLLTCPFYLIALKRIKAAQEWLTLDAHGHLVRKLYLLNGVLLIVSLGIK